MRSAPAFVVKHRCLCLLTLLAVTASGFARTATDDPINAVAAAELRTLDSRLDHLQREVEHNREATDRRLASDFAMVNARLDDGKDATRWALGLLTLLAAVGTVLGSWSWWTNRKDGASLLTEQINGIGKLRHVIDLVGQSFELQLKRETDLQAFTEQLKAYHLHFIGVYGSVRDRILSLRSVSRMGWSGLSDFQLALAASARAELRTIPASELKEVAKADPYEFARVCQLLGASAFYANDIEHAEQLLRMAKETYTPLPDRTDHRESLVATYYFLGLIAKSWVEENRPLQDALGDAKRHLEKAGELLESKPNEFLVPVTLAEVESYIEGSRSTSRRRLESLLPQLEALPSRDDNQSKLLVRAYLLRGNLHKGEQAASAYQAALRHDPKSSYAMLSFAHNHPEGKKRQELFISGLETLKEARALEKHELTTRATALAWAVLATHELGQNSQRDLYLKTLENIRAATVSAGGRIPLFFSPVSRTIRTFEDLRSEIDSYVAEAK